MAHPRVFAFGLIVILGLTNAFILPEPKNQDQFFQITGLEGGVLTAYPALPPDGNTYPAAADVKVELPDALNTEAQEWSQYITSYGERNFYSKVNSWNEILVYLICPSCYPVHNYWTVEPIGSDGYGVLSTKFIPDEKSKCIINNGLGNKISFGACDRTPGSSSQWKIVPIVQ